MDQSNLEIMAQERIDDWWEYAKDLARAERELQIERWVYVSIEYKDEAGRRCRLHSYDLPRELHERYRWVIRWREAKLQCQYPRENINVLQLLRQAYRASYRFQFLPDETRHRQSADYAGGTQGSGISGIPTAEQPFLR